MQNLSKKTEQDVLDAFGNYLDKFDGNLPYDLTVEKIESRGRDKVVKDDGVCVTLDRHHAILGTYYYPGQPMTSFVEVEYTYFYDLVLDEIFETDDKKLLSINGVQAGINSMLYGDWSASYKIKDEGAGLYELSTAMGNMYKVKSLKEALHYAHHEIQEMYFEFYLDQLNEYLNKKEIDDLRKKIKTGLDELFNTSVTDDITESWEENYCGEED